MKRSTLAAVAVVLLLIIGGVWWVQGRDDVNESANQPATSRLTDSAPDSNASTTISYEGVAGRSALDLLKENYTVETKKYDFGELVTSINGTAAVEGENFWEFLVNGEQATVGADQYETKSGDKIEWRLTEINATKQ